MPKVVWIFFLCLLGWAYLAEITDLGLVQAKEASILLEDIQIESSADKESLVLRFQQNYPHTPVFDFEPGILNVRLAHATLNLKDREFKPTGASQIKAIQALRSANSVVLNIHFEVLQNFEQKVSFQPNNNELRLQVMVNSAATAADNATLTNTSESTGTQGKLTQEITDRLQATETLAAQNDPNNSVNQTETGMGLPIQLGQEWAVTMVTLVLILLALVLFLYLMALFYNKVLATRFPNLQGGIRIKTAATFHVGPKQKVIVIDVNGRMFAIGVTPQTVSFLAEVTNTTVDSQFLERVSVDKQQLALKADQVRSDFFKHLEKARAQSTPKNPQATSKNPPATSIGANQKQQTAQEREEQGMDSARNLDLKGAKTKTPALDPLPFKANVSASENKSSEVNSPMSAGNKNLKLSAAMAEKPKSNFHTPVPTPTKEDMELKVGTDASMQQFASALSKKLKSLKPLH